MKKYLLILLTFTVMCQSQNTPFERVYIEVGAVKPLGIMADKFETSPSFGFWFRSRLVKEDFIDFGFNFFLPKNTSTINFKYKDSILEYKSKHFAINIGDRFAKVMPLSLQTKDFNFEWNSGIGLAVNAYQAPDEIEFENGDYSQEILTTFYLSQGMKINYKNIGLQCHYQWSPFNLFNAKIEREYGSQTLMFGIVYRQ